LPDGTSLNRGGSKLKPLGLPARLRHCLLSNQTVTELKVLTTKSATNYGFDVTDFKMITHLNPLSIQVNIRHKNPEKQVTIDDCTNLSEYIDEAIQNSSILNQPFTLEISSEGFGEILSEEKDFQVLLFLNGNRFHFLTDGFFKSYCLPFSLQFLLSQSYLFQWE